MESFNVVALPPLSAQAQSVLAGAVAGAAVHLSVFRRGEWHLQAPVLLTLWLLSTALIAAEAVRHSRSNSRVDPKLLFSAFAAFTCSIFCSIAIYRVYFHKLRRFPGPFWAKTTKLWHFIQCLKGPQYVMLDDLYHKYGPVVRTGPRELMVVHPDIHYRVANAKDGCGKTDWYDLLHPSRAIIGTRDRKVHDLRRRLWENACDANSRAEYVDRIKAHVSVLDDTIHRSAIAGEPVLANDLFSWFAFDIMGLFAFGKTFGMLENEEWHRAALQLRRGMGALGVLSCIPWLARIGFAYIPGLWIVKDWFQMRQFCHERMKERIDMKDSVDIASHMIRAAKENGLTEEDQHWLSGDGLTLIVGGSDTTSATITFLFYELALNPALTERVYEELREVDINSSEMLSKMTLFNAVINETLRLHPVLPSALYRETPSKGLVVGDTFIPGNTKILAPRWTTSRLESCFEEADRFVPERWIDRPEMIKKKNAYSPFGFGRWSCVGKNIALDEIRFVASRLVSKYHVGFAPGENGSSVERNTQDHVIAVPGDVRLLFRPRE